MGKKSNKKKILLLSDDMRMHSGIATQSKEFVMGTLDRYEWVQLGAAINHPENGAVVDMNPAVRNESGIKDAYLKIYPTSGYGNPDIVRQILTIEKPDAILHFTDPRFWIWLYQMEHEIRQNIPIFYYNIWDDLPTPKYNRNYYRSSDLLMSISKQTYGINKRLLPEYEDWQIKYVPHGINSKKFYKIEDGDMMLTKFKNEFGLNKYKFKILYLNRNIRRKMMGDVVMAYKYFMDKLDEEQHKECCLVFHTQPSDENGTDIRALCEAMLPEDYSVIFTHDVKSSFNDEEMNFIYNSSDVYINLASNEGFGLGSAEALMTETPIVVNVTGGLQDQCGFVKDNGSYLTADDYVDLGSNHRGPFRKCGEWAAGVFPSNVSLQGSPQTPYIFDDRVQYENAGIALKDWYDMSDEERQKCGKSGREYLLDKSTGMSAEQLCNNMSEAMDTAFEKWEPRKKYTLEVI